MSIKSLRCSHFRNISKTVKRSETMAMSYMWRAILTLYARLVTTLYWSITKMDTENMCLSRTRHNFVTILAVNAVLLLVPRRRGNVYAEMLFPNEDTKQWGSKLWPKKNKQELFFSFLETEFAELFQLKRDIHKSLRDHLSVITKGSRFILTN